MANKLGVIAAVGLTVSIVSLTAAAMVGGREYRDKGFDFFDWGFKDHCPFDENTGTSVRSFDWHGGNKVGIRIPAEVHYRAGSGGDKVEITGSAESLDHIRITDGNIKFDCSGGGDGELKVSLPGREFKSFSLQGSGGLFLENLNQPSLTLVLAGEGKVEAKGKAGHVELTMMGDSTAHLKDLEIGNIKLTTMGNSEADIAPKDEAEITIMGESTVRLMTEPKSVNTHVMGDGNIIHEARRP